MPAWKRFAKNTPSTNNKSKERIAAAGLRRQFYVIIMATFTGTIFSEMLGMRTGLNVVTPVHFDCDSPEPFRVVYLLHGLTDSHTCWSDNTQLTLFANEYNVLFLMPEVQRSFYANMAYGLPYYSYITEELPKICQKLFHISERKEDTYIMGLSMGGYGALKCALDRPNQYAGCGAFSSACDIRAAMAGSALMRKNELQGICGPDFEIPLENDLFALAEACGRRPEKPRIYMTCGTEDFLHSMNVRFGSHLQKLGFDAVYEEWSGSHDWYFWNESLHRALAHFFGAEKKEG